MVRNIINSVFSGPAYDKYSDERTRAYTESPTTFDYNIDANKAAGQFVADRTQELLGNNAISKGLGILGQAASVPVGFYSSFAHEAAQAKDRMQPGSGAKGFYDAFMAENPLSTAAQRAGGILSSIPGIGDAVYNMGAKAYDVLNSPIGTAQAAEVTPQSEPMDIEDFLGTSTPQNLGFIEDAPQVKEAIYQDRIMNPNLPSFASQPQYTMRGQIADDFGKIKNKIGSGLGSIKDFAIDKGRIGKNLIGSAGAMALGLPGIIGSGAMTLLSGLGNMFEDRQISGDGTIVDEFGRSYTADELNQQNALGGYYTDAARSSRRRTARIANMLARKAANKKISEKKLRELQAQEAAQEAARQAATTQMAAANRAAGTGGYQAGYGGDFMGGGGRGRGMGAADKGGSDSMGSFRDGGIASMFIRRR